MSKEHYGVISYDIKNKNNCAFYVEKAYILEYNKKQLRTCQYPEMCEAPSFFEPTSTSTGTQHRRPDVKPSLCSGRQKVC